MRRLGVAIATIVLAVSLAGSRQSSTSDASQVDADEESTQQAEGDVSYVDDFDWRFYPGTSDDDMREIVCWGDSMTQGVGADDDPGALVSLADGELYDTSYQSYPQVLSQLTGLDTYNFGVAGATSEEIAVMQGALPWATLDNGGADATSDADDKGENDDSDPETDTDAPADEGEQPIRHIDPEVVDEGEEHTGDILVLEIGSNGGWDGDYQVLIDQYRAMIDRSGCDDYLILGDTDDPGTSVGDTSQVPFTDDYAPRETSWETALREAFGDNFINMRVFLIKHGLEISGLTPTPEDVADARLGCISKQLRSDWTHLNARGYFAKAVAVYQRGIKLGYWSPGAGSIDVPKPQRSQGQAEGQG